MTEAPSPVAGPVHGPPPWLDDLHFDAGGPPWLTMGLSRLDPAAWLLPDEHRSVELAERHRLLAERHDEVFAALPGTDAAGGSKLESARPGDFEGFGSVDAKNRTAVLLNLHTAMGRARRQIGAGHFMGGRFGRC